MSETLSQSSCLHRRLGGARWLVAAAVLRLVAHGAPDPAMSTPEFTLVEVPARVAELAFSFLRPADFHALEVPTELPDFEDATKFVPLQVVMAGYGAVLFSVAARPAYGDGTLEDWAEYLARENKLQLQSLKPGMIGGLPAMLAETTQESEMGKMRMRTAFIEDGTRFLNLSIMAPEALWPSVERPLQTVLTSFRLTDPRGMTVKLTRAEAAAVASNTAEAPAPTMVDAADAVTVLELPDATELALASDASTLDPEHALNARLRENGVGFVARVLATDDEKKVATIGSGAIMATLQLPYGWHAIDDGRRILIFDASGKVQVSVNLREVESSLADLLDTIVAEHRREQPSLQVEPISVGAEIPGMLFKNYLSDGELLAQAFVLRTIRDDGQAHVARVTADPEGMPRALKLAELILRSLDQTALVAAR